MLCALDFALTNGVNKAILELANMQAIGAVSCLPVSDLWPQSAMLLPQLSDGRESTIPIGVSITLSGGFSPLASGFSPDNSEQGGRFPRLEDLAGSALRFSLDWTVLEAEFRTQLRRFVAHAGRQPDFVVLDEAILLFGAGARALTSALSHFSLSAVPILCPYIPSPSGMKERLLRRWIWKSNMQLFEPWTRREMVIPTSPQRMPQKSSRLISGRVWTAVRPGYLDERLEQFDEDPELRRQHFNWCIES